MSKALALALVLVFLTVSSIIVALPISGATEVENTWVEKAPMHQARDFLGVASVNGKIYAIGGYDLTYQSDTGSGQTGGIVDTNEEYDPNTNSWTAKSPMPNPRRDFATAVFRDKIYCIGGIANGHIGYDSNVTNVNEVYDTLTGTWETKTPMPAASGSPTANVVNGKIYVFSGTSNWVYDPISDVWSAKSPMPSELSFCGVSYPVFPYYAAVAIDNKIYVMSSAGGYSGPTGRITVMMVYDTENDTWSQGKQLYVSLGTYPVGAATTGVLAPKRIYFVGSQGAVYDPKLDTWSNIAVLNASAVGTVAVLDDRLYSIGGTISEHSTWFDTTYVRSAEVEMYTPFGYGTPDLSYVPPTEITPPKINITSPINLTYNESSVPLFFNSDKAVNWTSYSLDGQANVTFTGKTNLTDISNGLHTITVYSQDTFGNIGSSETTSFTVAKPEPESFPVVPVVAVVVSVALLAAGLLIYHKKHKQK